MTVTTGTPADALWGVGWYPSPSGRPTAYPATAAEMKRHEDTAERLLAVMGVGSDDIVLCVGRSSEAVQFAPWERATSRLGAAYCVVDGFKYDVHRLQSCITLFRPKALLGLVDELVEGFTERGTSAAEALTSVPIVAARPRAHSLLADQGLVARLWLHAGPAVAVECAAGRGAHLEAAWSPAIVDGTIRVTPGADQILAPSSIDTRIRAELDASTCACGSTDPRVRLTSSDLPD